MVVQETFEVVTRGRGFESVTTKVEAVLAKSRIRAGLCNVFTQHTSASLLITENADSAVRRDLERFMQRIAPDGSAEYEHDAEGPDDMPAHIRSMLTSATLTVPIAAGELQLGTWQGIYLWEHRHAGHCRQIVVTITGER
jgi:secondary thiamine-phosphate synthase enzyme